MGYIRDIPLLLPLPNGYGLDYDFGCYGMMIELYSAGEELPDYSFDGKVGATFDLEPELLELGD
jgi:hypothetical protein